MSNTKLKVIYQSFEGKLVGSLQMKIFVCETLLSMPKDIIMFVTTNCWFISSFQESWAFALTGNDLKDQHLIFLSDDLLIQSSDQIHWTIAHEIGHVVLGHKNSTLVQQTKHEISLQEKEADSFAIQFLSQPPHSH